MDTILLIGLAITAAVTGLNVALRTIAPMTKWTGDDKALGFLEKVESLLAKIFVPGKYLGKK